MVEIGFAKRADRDGILAFLDAHWQKGHVFTKDRHLFDWQHCLPGGDELSFVLGRRAEDSEILGILGYVPVAQFDPDAVSDDFTLATWKVRDDCEINGLGIFLFKALTRRLKPSFVGVVGLSEMVVPIYRAMRFETGTMSQHVFFNRQSSKFDLAQGVSVEAKPDFDDGAEVFCTSRDLGRLSGELVDVASRLMLETLPRRELPYLAGRYGSHPSYRYVMSFAGADACFVWRKIDVGGTACLRVVDYFGATSGLEDFGSAFQKLLEEEDAEYIDIVHVGLEAASLQSAGFVDRRAVKGLVVPHYFEPFEPRNVDLDYALRVFDKQERLKPILLRGFTDQDRPNISRDAQGAVPYV